MFEMPMLPRTFDAAYRDSHDKRPKVRAEAIFELVRATREEQREQTGARLVAALADPIPAVVIAALLGLADLGWVQAQPQVERLLTHPDLNVRAYAVLSFGELGQSDASATAERLAPFLCAREPRIRYQALMAVGRLTPTVALPTLLDSLCDEDDEVVDGALRLLEEGLVAGSYIQEPRVQEALLRVARQGRAGRNHRVEALAQRIAIEQELDAPQDALVRLIRGDFAPREASDLLAALELIGRRRLPGFEAALERRAFGWFGFSLDPCRYLAQAVLAALGQPRAAKLVRRHLTHGNRVARVATINAIGLFRVREFSELLRAARKANPGLEGPIDEALGRLDEP